MEKGVILCSNYWRTQMTLLAVEIKQGNGYNLKNA